MENDLKKIRNFCIIAHIDHGKSTLADRLLEVTGTVDRRLMKEQLLDSMDLERERGITIKLQPVRMRWQEHTLNLIDTPGHIDFNYEVSRSLAAVEGALLLVDATQGIEAQTLANLYLAMEQQLVIIPVINKIDLPAADVPAVTRAITRLIGCEPADIIAVSAKTGENATKILDAIIARIPPPSPDKNDYLRALIFDAEFDEYKGVVIYTKIMSGSVKVGSVIRFLQTAAHAEVLEVGHFAPQLTPTKELSPGEIGYIITNIKSIEQARVGDTVAAIDATKAEPLPGYRESQPMVFAGIYPGEGDEYEKLRKAIYRLKLNDASLTFIPDHSDVLGFGFRCGFLGLLHLEIFQERLRREYGLSVVVTAPTVGYRVFLKSGEEMQLTSPAALPDENHIDYVEQPMVIIDLITPQKYMGNLMEYIQRRRGVIQHTEYLDENRLLLKYRIPLSSIVIDFYDSVKNISSGYASYTYERSGYERCSLVRVDFLIAEDKVPALSILVYRDDVQSVARRAVIRLKEILPRAQFAIKIQAAVGGKVIAAERLSALRKDVTAKLYGGDVTRKRKLLDKQKKGKKKMSERGSIRIPHQAYLAILKRD